MPRSGERPRRDVHLPETEEALDCVRSTAEKWVEGKSDEIKSVVTTDAFL